MNPNLEPGLVGEASAVVTETETAQAIGSGDVPVLGTPALVALLEQAAVNAIAGRLDPGLTTVGVQIDVRHLAATPGGATVRARATLTAVKGRSLTFHLVAHDEVEQVAEGAHRRVIVDRARFVHKANAKRSAQR